MKKTFGILGIFILLAVILIPNYTPKRIEERNDETLDWQNEYFVSAEKTIVEEKGFGIGSINVSKFRNSAVISCELGQLTAYFDADGTAWIALVDQNKIYKTKIIDTMEKRLTGDGHCSINIGYYNGNVWYAYGSHCTYGYYGIISGESLYRCSAITAKKMDQKITYPSFYHIGQEFYFVYRNDDDDCNWYYQVLSDREDIEFTDQKLFLAGNMPDVIYINDVASSSDGKYIAIPFVNRIKSADDLVRNDGVYLIYSSDYGRTWNSVGKSDLVFPIQIDEVEKVVDIGLEENLMNQESTYVTDDGMIYFTRMTDDENGIPQLWLDYYDTQRETYGSRVVSDNKKGFNLLGKGTLVLPLSRAEVLVNDRYVNVIYRQEDQIVIATVKQAELGKKEFERNILSEVHIGAWEPNCDKEKWRTEGSISLFVESVEQGSRDQLQDIENATPIMLYNLTQR